MNNEEIASALRSAEKPITAVGLAELLEKLTGEGLSQGLMITNFKRAFSSIPLRVLLDAGGWHRLSGGGLTDEQFNELLAPWLETR